MIAMKDSNYDGLIYFLSRAVPAAVLVLLMMRLYGCNNDNSITDCSSRGRPQYQDAGGRWTCDERGQR